MTGPWMRQRCTLTANSSTMPNASIGMKQTLCGSWHKRYLLVCILDIAAFACTFFMYE